MAGRHEGSLSIFLLERVQAALLKRSIANDPNIHRRMLVDLLLPPLLRLMPASGPFSLEELPEREGKKKQNQRTKGQFCSLAVCISYKSMSMGSLEAAGQVSRIAPNATPRAEAAAVKGPFSYSFPLPVRPASQPIHRPATEGLPMAKPRRNLAVRAKSESSPGRLAIPRVARLGRAC